MAIHLLTGKVGDGKSAASLKRQLHEQLSSLLGQRVNIHMHTGKPGLFFSLSSELRLNSADPSLFTVTILEVPSDPNVPTSSACVCFTADHVQEIRKTPHGVIINVL